MRIGVSKDSDKGAMTADRQEVFFRASRRVERDLTGSGLAHPLVLTSVR